MKVLLTGRHGQVGHELVRLLGEDVLATDRSALDLSDPAQIVRVVRDLRPAVIVNAAAYTAVDRAESEPEAAMAINGVAPGVLAEEAQKLGAVLVHYSTDYIFDGSKAGAYTEEDPPNPLNVYGRTKLEGEKRIAASGCRHLLLRTSWVYAPRGRNFFIAIAQKARRGEALRVVADQRGVPAESRYIAEATGRLLERKCEGVYNLVPAGETTWHGFAQAIVSGLGLPAPVAAIRTEEYPTPARRPRNSVLDPARLARLLGEPPSWESLLERCLREWNST